MKTILIVVTLGLGILAGCNNKPFGMAVNLHAQPIKTAQETEVVGTGRIDPSLPVASDVFAFSDKTAVSETDADKQPCLSVGACE